MIDVEVNAQHPETGRVWFGQRSQIPAQFQEVMCQTHRFSPPCPVCARSTNAAPGASQVRS